MNSIEVFKQTIIKRNIIKHGHFLLRHGDHSNSYINKDAIYCRQDLFRRAVLETIELIKPYEKNFDVVVGPAVGGSLLASPISILLKKDLAYTEKIEGKQLFREVFDNTIKGRKVWITEDVMTTGGSVQKVIDSVNNLGGIVIGVSLIWNRLGKSPFEDASLYEIFLVSLFNEKIDKWEEAECPLCKEGVPLTNPKTNEIITERIA